jgi:ATP-dependent exoDNAse (exonuclease V) beta subunit
MSKLQVYKASAGSGKTFQLIGRYLYFLFQHPANYRHVLGVTFTNKAAEEMKKRIVYQLYLLSNELNSPYEQQLREAFNLTVKEIKEESRQQLQNILHDFFRFSISTIDTFFQQIIRAFAKEMGLQAGFNLELENDKVLNNVVDRILSALDESPHMVDWLSRFAETKISEGKSWNIKNDMINLGKEVFKEHVQSLNRQLKANANNSFFNDYLHDIQQIIQPFETFMQQNGQKALSMLSNNGLVISDFKYGHSGFANYFKKISTKTDFQPGKRVWQAVDNIDMWITKSSPKKEIIEHVYDELNNLLNDILVYYKQHFRDYYTAREIGNHLFTFGIIHDIADEVNNYTSEEDIFLISDSSTFLNEIISNNDAPFIFEKTGNMFRHYMIDEFQDTSRLQWENFKPLINNSLAENYSNLIVGDVKQSIYRWRNSDWDILAEQIDNKYPASQIQHFTLNNNYRSRTHIIQFNNSLFSQAQYVVQNKINELMEDEALEIQPEHLTDKVLNAYHDPIQNLPPGNIPGGYIHASFYAEDEFNERIHEEIPGKLVELFDKGYKPGDIAFLVRKNTEGQELAKMLLQFNSSGVIPEQYKFNIISEDSLFLKHASSIKIILCCFKYLIFPHDEINKKILSNEYYHYILKHIPDKEKQHDLFGKQDTNNPLSFEKLVPEQLITDLFYLRQYPLYELTEQIIALFGLNRIQHEIPYIEAFQDIVNDFTTGDSTDIHSFLSYWDETGSRKTLDLPEQQNAIRILTIHKSKGLEFDVVMIPFCHWKLNNTPGILWCPPSCPPFDKLQYVPVQYSKQLKQTHFYREYFDEYLKAHVDNLNLLYVAFTRARECLITWSVYKQESRSSQREPCSTVAQLMEACFLSDKRPDENNTFSLDEFWDTDHLQFTKGDIPQKTHQPTATDNSILMDHINAGTMHHTLQLRHYGKDFFSFNDKPVEEQLNYGTIMHEVLRNINTPDDIDQAIRRVFLNGLISQDERQKISELLHNALQNKDVREWFTTQWNVKTEADILLPDGRKVRPDRILIRDNQAIVIDYKFGLVEEKAYQQQVQYYMNYLSDMGYLDIKGYLWYVGLDKIEEVALS